METPINDLENELRTLTQLSKQEHPSFRKYDKRIPIYEKAIEVLKEAETSDNPKVLNMGDVSVSLPIESFDADDWLGKNRDIFNHPYIKDRTNINGYEVAQLMADFANSIIQK